MGNLLVQDSNSKVQRGESTKGNDKPVDSNATEAIPKPKTWSKAGSKKAELPKPSEPETTQVKLKKVEPNVKPVEEKSTEKPSLKPLKRVIPNQMPTEETKMEKPSLKPLKKVEQTSVEENSMEKFSLKPLKKAKQKPVEEESKEKTVLKPVPKKIVGETTENQTDDDDIEVNKVKKKKVKKIKKEIKSQTSDSSNIVKSRSETLRMQDENQHT